VSTLAKEHALLQYGPVTVQGYQRDTAYLKLLIAAKEEESNKQLQQELNLVLDENEEKRKQIKDIATSCQI
jgi:hypothetical protein